jgi:hypothetical protein
MLTSMAVGVGKVHLAVTVTPEHPLKPSTLRAQMVDLDFSVMHHQNNQKHRWP